MNKDGKTKRNHKRAPGQKIHEKVAQGGPGEIGGQHKDRQFIGLEQQETVQKERKNEIYDLGTIPPVTVTCKQINPVDKGVDMFYLAEGMTISEFLEIMSNFFFDQDFEWNNDVEAVERMIVHSLEELMNGCKLEINEDHVSIEHQYSFTFSYVYIFTMTSFDGVLPVFPQRVAYAFLKQVCLHTGLDWLDDQWGWYKEYIDDSAYGMNDDPDEQKAFLERYETILGESEDFQFHIERQCNSIGLDLERDYEWILDVFRHYKLFHVEKNMELIMTIIKRVNPKMDSLIFGNEGVMNTDFTCLHPEIVDELLIEDRVSYANEMGMSPVFIYTVTKETNPMGSSLDAYYMDKILNAMTEIIYHPLTEEKDADT